MLQQLGSNNPFCKTYFGQKTKHFSNKMQNIFLTKDSFTELYIYKNIFSHNFSGLLLN